MILKLPSLSQKCHDLTNLIKERFASNMSRNILAQFRPIVENIFGHDTALAREFSSNVEYIDNLTSGWMLKNLTRLSNSSDYDSVVTFLHPDGIIFALIKALMTETSAKFEFPVNQFPPYFRYLVESGTAPPFFANKIVSNSFTATSNLILNAFEFYIFHFALYILNHSMTSYESASTIGNEPAYFTLLKIYLNHFVPSESSPRVGEPEVFGSAKNDRQTSIWQSLSSTTTSIFQLATSNQVQNSDNRTSSSQPSIFKQSIFQPQTAYDRNPSSNFTSVAGPILYGQGEHIGSIEWRCSHFILLITELWFGNIPAPKTNFILRSVGPDDVSSSTTIQPFSANIDQTTSVRIVIKHLHNFMNSFTYNPVSHANHQGLAEIKQAIWTSKYPLQKRLYNFIKVAFNRWPMDYTFRQPLEAWLSYIQPWRYVKISNNDSSNDFEDYEGARSPSLVDSQCVDNHWRNFISDNLLYYTVIFTILVNRLLQLDLSSSRNALMMFRAIKVYTQPGFLALLQAAEEAMLSNNLDQSFQETAKNVSPQKLSSPADPNSSKATLLAPSFLASGRCKSKMSSPLENHLLHLEGNSDFEYVSLFGTQTRELLSKLLYNAQKSRILIKEFVKSVDERTDRRSSGWLDSVWSFFTMEDSCFESKDEREMYKDKRQADEYLNFAMNRISQCFELPIPRIDNINNTANLSRPRIFFTR